MNTPQRPSSYSVRPVFFFWVPLLFAFALLVAGLACGPSRPLAADRVFRNGVVLTLDGDSTVQEALAVSGERIVAVGTESAIARYIGKSTLVKDLQGGVLMPGFVDAHSHLIAVGEKSRFMVDASPPPVGQTRTIAEMIEAIRQRAANTPAGEWIVAAGYDDTLLAEGRHPTRDDLDRATKTHPVVALHVSLHFVAANSMALELAGFRRDTPEPDGGKIRRARGGEPNGVLEETAARRMFFAIPTRSDNERREAIRDAARAYARAGVTTAQNGYTVEQQIRDLEGLAAEGGLPIRVVALPDLATTRKLESGELTARESLFFRIGGTKIIADGSIQGFTGYLSSPYAASFGGDRNYRGYPTFDAVTLAAQIAEVHRAGRQVVVHGNGDAAIDDILAGFAAMFEERPDPDARPVVIHAQMAREDQLETMAELGVIPSFFVLHTYYWGDRHRDIFLGPERAARISPTRSAADRDIPYTIHTDSPVVPMEPLRLVWSAVNRLTTSGQLLGGDQRVAAMEALRATTIDAARQEFLDTELGSLEVGKLADLVLLSGNPLADPEAIADIRVVETIVGGKTVFPPAP